MCIIIYPEKYVYIDIAYPEKYVYIDIIYPEKYGYIGTHVLLSLLFCTFEHFIIKNKISGNFPGGSDNKESTCNAGDLGSIPRSGRSPGEGNSYPLQYSCLENSMDKGTWQATVQKSPSGCPVENSVRRLGVR